MSGDYRGSLLSRPWLTTGASAGAAAVLTLLLWSPWSRPGVSGRATLRLYCAAGMSGPVAEIISDYEREYGARVEVTYDGSGALLSKIRTAGRRGDLYLAADAGHMKDARAAGLVDEVLPVAIIRPVLVVQRKTQERLRQAGRPVTTAADLLRDDLKTVIADPNRTSIGGMTETLLQRSGLWARLRARLGERTPRASTVGTVNEVVQQVRTRDDSVGVAWDAVVAPHADLEAVTPPEFAGASERVYLGVLSKSADPTAALQFARYLTARDRGGAVFVRHHFEPVADADEWEERPTLHLSAGAMLKPALDDAVKAFAEREGVKINTSYAGCGLLVAQMEGLRRGRKPGRFPDVYFACDTSFLDAVQDWFEPGRTVARNDAVLIIPRGNPHNVRALADLARKELRVGLAHPTNSALGKLTERLLREQGLYDAVHAPDRKAGVVHADAAHLLVNQMRAGALDAAVVYRSNARSAAASAEDLDVVELGLPAAQATQPFAVARDSRHKYLARRLLRAVLAPESAERFRRLGFHWAAGPDGLP